MKRHSGLKARVPRFTKEQRKQYPLLKGFYLKQRHGPHTRNA